MQAVTSLIASYGWTLVIAFALAIACIGIATLSDVLKLPRTTVATVRVAENAEGLLGELPALPWATVYAHGAEVEAPETQAPPLIVTSAVDVTTSNAPGETTRALGETTDLRSDEPVAPVVEHDSHTADAISVEVAAALSEEIEEKADVLAASQDTVPLAQHTEIHHVDVGAVDDLLDVLPHDESVEPMERPNFLSAVTGWFRALGARRYNPSDLNTSNDYFNVNDALDAVGEGFADDVEPTQPRWLRGLRAIGPRLDEVLRRKRHEEPTVLEDIFDEANETRVDLPALQHDIPLHGIGVPGPLQTAVHSGPFARAPIDAEEPTSDVQATEPPTIADVFVYAYSVESESADEKPAATASPTLASQQEEETQPQPAIVAEIATTSAEETPRATNEAPVVQDALESSDTTSVVVASEIAESAPSNPVADAIALAQALAGELLNNAIIANDLWARELIGTDAPIELDTRRELLSVYALTPDAPRLMQRVIAEDPELADYARELLNAA